MRRQILTPFDMLALSWACSAAMADFYLRSFDPMQPPPVPGEAGSDLDELAPMTAKDEVLLLHLME
jgi:hypothetical protein